MIKKIFSILFIVLAITGCTRNAITGRSQFKLLPESELQSMATSQYQEFLSSNKVVATSTNRDAEMVTRVGERIRHAVESYYASKGLSKQLEGYHWEYHLVENNEANAWCMPGGKIVVYTGLLPYTQNEAALAVVMGHEISHALFQHGNERMSQALGVQAVNLGLEVAMANKPAETRNVFLSAYGAGAQVGVLLPFPANMNWKQIIGDLYGPLWQDIIQGRQFLFGKEWKKPPMARNLLSF